MGAEGHPRGQGCSSEARSSFPGRCGIPGGQASPPRPRDAAPALPVRAAAGGDAPAARPAGGCGPAVPLPSPPRRARGRRALPARRAAGAPPAAARTPSAAPLRLSARPGLSRPPAGGGPGSPGEAAAARGEPLRGGRCSPAPAGAPLPRPLSALSHGPRCGI